MCSMQSRHSEYITIVQWMSANILKNWKTGLRWQKKNGYAIRSCRGFNNQIYNLYYFPRLIQSNEMFWNTTEIWKIYSGQKNGVCGFEYRTLSYVLQYKLENVTCNARGLYEDTGVLVPRCLLGWGTSLCMNSKLPLLKKRCGSDVGCPNKFVYNRSRRYWELSSTDMSLYLKEIVLV